MATYLKSKGVTLEVCDLNLKLYREADQKQRHYWDLDTINKFAPVDIAHDLFNDFEDTLEVLISTLDFDIIAFSANNLISTTFTGIMGVNIKKRFPKAKIILGGPGCFHSWDRNAVPKDAVDFFVIGEGEEALYRLIKMISQKSQDRIPGVLYSGNVKNKQFLPPEPIKNIDIIPFPTFEEFDVSNYSLGEKYHALPMITSRGCINQCAYCIDCYMCAPFRLRDPDIIVAEMQYHKQHYGITHVEFNDLLCNGNLNRLEKLCDQLINADLNISWNSYAAIRKNMTLELLTKMRRAGCVSLCFGVESGSDLILKKMNKHYTKDDAHKLLKRTYEVGIDARLNIIVGFPGETEFDFIATLDFIQANKNYINQVTNVSSFVLMPGSDIGVYAYKFGIKFLNPNDPGVWVDANGLTQSQRNDRVLRLCQLLENLEISNLIVNYQKDKCVNKLKECETVTVVKSEISQEIIEPTHNLLQNNRIKRSFGKIIMCFIIFVLSLLIDIYLFILKKIRGSIIFPGS